MVRSSTEVQHYEMNCSDTRVFVPETILCFSGISAETHQMLEQAFCVTEFHNAAHSILITQSFLSLLVSTVLTLLL